MRCKVKRTPRLLTEVDARRRDGAAEAHAALAGEAKFGTVEMCKCCAHCERLRL